LVKSISHHEKKKEFYYNFSGKSNGETKEQRKMLQRKIVKWIAEQQYLLILLFISYVIFLSFLIEWTGEREKQADR